MSLTVLVFFFQAAAFPVARLLDCAADPALADQGRPSPLWLATKRSQVSESVIE
jgi:hypothetical protein